MTEAEIKVMMRVPEGAVLLKFTPKERTLANFPNWITLYYSIPETTEFLSRAPNNNWRQLCKYYKRTYYKRYPKWYWGRRAELQMLGEHEERGFDKYIVWRKDGK